MSSTNRRSFLARGAALAAVPTVAALAAGALADPASASTLPDFAPIPTSRPSRHRRSARPSTPMATTWDG